jgi:hypothetical protein
VRFDDAVDLRIQPAGVAKLDGDPPAEVAEQKLEQLRVALAGRRELQQHRSGAIAERQDPGAEVPGDDVLRKAGRRIGERPLGLQAKPEVGWRVPDPLREGRLLG